MRVLDVKNIVRAEAAENFERQDFTLSEAVAIKRALEPEMREEAESRMRAGRPYANFAQGPTREKVAPLPASATKPCARPRRSSLRRKPTPSGLASCKPTWIEKAGRRGLPQAHQHAARRPDSRRAAAAAIRAIIEWLWLDPPWPYDVREDDPTQLVGHAVSADQRRRHMRLACRRVSCMTTRCCGCGRQIAICSKVQRLPCSMPGASIRRTMLTWTKQHLARGHWLRNQTEHCILATRGRPVLTLTNQTTALLAPRGKHSEKPEAFYALVQSLFPAPGYLELFARKARPGWTVWGDEVSSPADTEFRYVAHADVEARQREGWILREALTGTHHGEYAVLMEAPAAAGDK